MPLGPETPFLLAEDLALLTLDPDSGKQRRNLGPQLVGGALVVDLALRERVRRDGAHPRLVVDGSSPDDDLLAGAHAATTGHRPSIPGEVGRRAGDGALEPLLRRLVAREVLRRHEGRTLGVRHVRWPAVDTTRRDRVGQVVADALRAGAAADEHTFALGWILVHTGLARAVLPISARVTHGDLLDGLRSQLAGLPDDRVTLLAAAMRACGEPLGGDTSVGGVP